MRENLKTDRHKTNCIGNVGNGGADGFEQECIRSKRTQMVSIRTCWQYGLLLVAVKHHRETVPWQLCYSFTRERAKKIPVKMDVLTVQDTKVSLP